MSESLSLDLEMAFRLALASLTRLAVGIDAGGWMVLGSMLLAGATLRSARSPRARC